MVDDGAPSQRAGPTASQGSLHLENSFEENGVGGEHVLDLPALEDDVFQRYLSAQPDPTAFQRSNRVLSALIFCVISTLRPTCAPLPASRTAAAGLDPQGGGLSPRAPMSYTLAAAAFDGIELHSSRCQDPAPFQLPDCRQPARSLTDLLTALAATLGRRKPRNVLPLHTAQAVHEVVTEGYRILDTESRDGDFHVGRLGASLRDQLFLE